MYKDVLLVVQSEYTILPLQGSYLDRSLSSAVVSVP